MNYSEQSTNQQRLEIAAYGFQKVVTPDCYDVRAAMAMQDIAREAARFSDPAKSTLAFAVFLKAAKMAGLTPEHILAWIARGWGGKKAIVDFAVSELGMTKKA
jgi:hypothetical protein